METVQYPGQQAGQMPLLVRVSAVAVGLVVPVACGFRTVITLATRMRIAAALAAFVLAGLPLEGSCSSLEFCSFGLFLRGREAPEAIVLEMRGAK